MITYLLKRTLILFLTLLLVSIAIFAVLMVIPGDPAQIILGIHATPETLRNLRHQMGLDRPVTIQYLHYMKNLALGDLGRSITYDVSITSLIISRLQVTIPLAILSLIFAVSISIPMGIYSSLHRNRLGDYGVMVFSQVGLAVPAFWAGILLILLFAVTLQWLPAGGFHAWQTDPIKALRSLLLPAFSLGFVRAAVLTRMTRSSMLEVLGEDYIRTARSKGLPKRRVVYKHAFRNAIIPVVTIVGLQAGDLLAGAIIIENVFHLPGVGRLVFEAIGQRDLPVIQGVILLIAVMIVVINFLIDVLYRYLDPRIRYK
ncbi:MAG: ABC transporter permease [Thermodesulfobacteriota bacterium]|nr:ABC transporter permease [Thermodesulfobacteriota bacterium]